MRELAGRSKGRFDKTVKLLRFSNNINHTKNLDHSLSVFDALAVIAFLTCLSI